MSSSVSTSASSGQTRTLDSVSGSSKKELSVSSASSFLSSSVSGGQAAASNPTSTYSTGSHYTPSPEIGESNTVSAPSGSALSLAE